MTAEAQEVLQAALALPTPDRGGLAEMLLASIDEPADGDAEQIEAAWSGEFETRARRFLDGRPWVAVREDVARRLSEQ